MRHDSHAERRGGPETAAPCASAIAGMADNSHLRVEAACGIMLYR